MENIPKVIDKVKTKNGVIQLQKRNKDFEIIFNGIFLMATYNEKSAKLLVSHAIDKVNLPRKVLIGGLGVGFSLAEALKYEEVEKITLVEIESCIIDWNKKYLNKFSNNALKDPRVDIINADFIEWMRHTNNKYDVICLDIDNGPDWTVLNSNKGLYGCKGLLRLKEMLNYGGAISFWSSSKSDRFERRLKTFFREVLIYPVSCKNCKPDYIYICLV